MKSFRSFSIAVLLFAPLLAWTARGGDSCGCCPHCGCREFKQVCRLVQQIVKTPKVEYSCKCEDICVPGKSQCVGTECVTDSCGNVCHQKVYQPTCGKVYTKVTPGKTTTMIEKCTYKCVVETVCCNCGCGGGAAQPGYYAPGYAPPTTEAPHLERDNLRNQSN